MTHGQTPQPGNPDRDQPQDPTQPRPSPDQPGRRETPEDPNAPKRRNDDEER